MRSVFYLSVAGLIVSLVLEMRFEAGAFCVLTALCGIGETKNG